MEQNAWRERLDQADMVLVGLGEEFDASCEAAESEDFQRGKLFLKEHDALWLLPGWSGYCAWKLGKEKTETAVKKLFELFRGKNHFAVSVSTNGRIQDIWGEERLVTPCGNARLKQCSACCGEQEPIPLTGEDHNAAREFFDRLWEEAPSLTNPPGFGTCPCCGEPMICHNIYAPRYDERGYLKQWNLYTKWLQGTLQKRLVMLELGVSMGYPSVIRHPLERVAACHEKAYLIRVNEKLPDLPEELKAKGTGISANAIDWICKLC